MRGPGQVTSGPGFEQDGEADLRGCGVAGRGGHVREDGRRARIITAVTVRDATAGAGELVQRLCRFAVDEMALSGCALVLMSGADSASVLASAGRHAQTVTGLQMELGEARACRPTPPGFRCCRQT